MLSKSRVLFLVLCLVLSACSASATPLPAATATTAPTIAVPTATIVPPSPTTVPSDTPVPPSPVTPSLTPIPATPTLSAALQTGTAVAKLPTKTPQPTNTVGPTTLVLNDEFSGKCDLTVADDAKRKMGCANGVYTLGLKAANLTQWTYYSTRNNTNAIYEVDGKITGHTGPMLWGLIFRVSKDGNRFYELMLDDGGQVGLNLYERGKAARELLRFTKVAGYKPDAFNRLKAVAQGSTIAVYLNDEWVNTVTDTTLTSGLTGVLLAMRDPNAEVTFDNFQVTRINSSIEIPKGKAQPAAPPAAQATSAPAANTNPCNLNAGDSGLLLINNYDVEVLMTIGGGEWGTHDFHAAAHTTLPIQFPPGKYTTTLTVPGVGNFRFADGRADFDAGKCYNFRVP